MVLLGELHEVARTHIVAKPKPLLAHTRADLNTPADIKGLLAILEATPKHICECPHMTSSMGVYRLTFKVQQTWSQFQFFVKCIEEALANGSTASEALQSFELQRGDQSMLKFHKFLQPKKGAKSKGPLDLAGATLAPQM